MFWYGVLCAVVLALYRLRAVPVNKSVVMSPAYIPFFGTTPSLIYEFLIKGELTGGEYSMRELKRIGKWGPIGWAHIGGDTGVFIVDPKDIKHMQVTAFYNFEKDLTVRFEELLGTGIFVANGAEWKKQRIIASHMFNRRQLRERMSSVFGIHAMQVVDAFAAHAETGNSFDMQKAFYKYTFDCINEVAFERSRSPSDAAFQSAFDKVQRALPTRFYMPWWRLSRVLNISHERVIKENMQVINEYVEAVLADYKRNGVTAGDSTMTGLFLQHAEETGEQVNLRDVLLNFIIAGRDTTGSALTSAVNYLCLNPECQAKLHEEASRVFNGGAEPLTFDDIEETAPYSLAVVMEALRLRPSVPENEKIAVKDTTLPSGAFISKGYHVTWSTYVTNRHPDVWENPESFDPDRWLSGETPDDFQYNTFNGGPRLCLGKSMALLEARIMLLTLVSKYTLSLKEGFVPKPVVTITWQLNELQICVSKRS